MNQPAAGPFRVVHETLSISTRGQGTLEVTDQVQRVVAEAGIDSGMCTVFCRHTSCSLVIMENADPTARADLEAYFDRLVPEEEPYFRHTAEGPDDMPSHIKMALTRTSETVPIDRGRLMLGTWQGLYLWEHRASRHQRQLIVTVMGV